MTVCQVVVHRAQTRSTWVAHPAHLHGRRLTGEARQTIFAGVAGKIDQNVDAVGYDFLRQCRVRKPRNAVPGIEMRTQPRRNASLDRMIVIGVKGQTRTRCKMFQYRLKKIGHRVITQIS